MRNAKRKVRRLRHERNHYRELLSFVMERNHTLENINRKNAAEVAQRGNQISYLDNVRGNQSQEIIRLNDVIFERDTEIEDLHRAHALSLATVLFVAVGALALAIGYVYFKTH